MSDDTAQGLSVGDAVLHFLADTTQLDIAFNRIADQTAAAMGKAASSVSQVGDAVDGVADRMAVGASGAQKLGEVTTLAGEKAKFSMYEARGEAGLLGEAFGISLPRHVRSFIAELPGVGTALSAAFTATAVLFLIDALAQGIEKIQQWSEKSMKIAEAWDHYNQTIFEASTGMQKEIDRLQQKFIEMTQGPVAGLDFALKHLETTAFETFTHIEKAVADAVKAMNEASSSLIGIQFNVFKDAAKDLDRFKDKLQSVMREAAQAQPGDPFAAYKAGIEAVQQKERDLTALIKQRTAASGADASAAVNGLHAERQAINDMLPLLQQGIELQKEKDKVLKQSRADEAAAQDATKAKEFLDAQLANIEAWKTAQHSAYESGKIDLATWLAAEVHASDAAAIAHEDYLKKIIALYVRPGETIKAQEAQQELATLQTKSAAQETEKAAAAIDKHRSAVAKLREEYAHLIDAGVAKDFEATAKAAEKLTLAEQELGRAQSKLAEGTLSQHYKDQETAISKLAEMQLITEQQKNDRLALLEQQQATAAIGILNEQLAKEQAAVSAAEAKFSSLKISIGVSPEQILEAEANLKKLETAVVNTQAQIVQTQEKFNKQSEADSKSHYGRAYLEAVAFGQQLLSEALRENHAALIAKEQELSQAQARHENTDAIKEEIAALKQKEQVLEKAAAGDTKAAAALLKHDQAQLAAAKTVLADAKARGVDTIAIEQHIKSLQADTASLDQAVNGDRKLLAARMQVTQAHLQAAQAILQLSKDQGLDTTVIDQNIVALQLQLKALQQQAAEFPKVKVGMEGLKNSLKELTGGLEQFERQTSQAFATAIMGALESGKSMGAALEAATKQILENLAEQALAKSIFYTAQGIADANTPGMEEFAPGEFAAAEMFALIAGVSGAAGIAMPGGGGSSNGPGAQQGPSVSQSTSSGGGSTQTGSVTKLAEGGVVSKPTMFMAGDSPSGGEAEEAILPLSDPSAMRQVAKAIAPGGLPQSTPAEESGFDPTAIERMMEAISALTGTRSAAQEFHFAEPGTSEKQGFQFADFTVGEALGFHSGETSPSANRDFEKSPGTVGDALGFDRSQGSSESGKADFAAAQSSPSPAPGFEAGSSSPVTAEARGFKFDSAFPGEKPIFSPGGSPSGSAPHDFSAADGSPSPQRDFPARSPQTVGEALGFTFAPPAAAHENLGFTNSPQSTTTQRSFESAIGTPHEKRSLEFSEPSVGERPGFDFSAPSLPREMPDMESLASQFGGLLSTPTLRAASDAQVPAAATAASSSRGGPVDLDAHMGKFADHISSRIQEGSTGDTTHIHVNVKGSVDHGTIAGLVKKINRKVQNRQLTLKASDSLRVTRRSQ